MRTPATVVALVGCALPLLLDGSTAEAGWLCRRSAPCPSRCADIPSPSYTLFCCLGGQWSRRGDFYTYDQADQWAQSFCAGHSYKVVPYGQILSGGCAGRPPCAGPAPTSAVPADGPWYPSYTLFCCIGGFWQFRGNFYDYTQAYDWAQSFCVPYGCSYQIVPFGMVVSGRCINYYRRPVGP